MVTERLYYTDSALLEFTASVLDIKPAGEVYHVVLDRTGFYPTGGGQPNDTGRLDDSRVIDVIDDDEDGRVLHVVSSLGSLAIGNQVTGTIDAALIRSSASAVAVLQAITSNSAPCCCKNSAAPNAYFATVSTDFDP